MKYFKFSKNTALNTLPIFYYPIIFSTADFCPFVLCFGRYGRVPKPIQPLTYPSKEDPHASESETASKSKCVVKRGKLSKQQTSQKFKKPRLVTIRSSKSDFSDEESENEFENNQMEGEHLGCRSSKDAEASLFVPSSLHPTNMVVSEVDDAMVEVSRTVSCFVSCIDTIIFFYSFIFLHNSVSIILCLTLLFICAWFYMTSFKPSNSKLSLTSWTVCLMCWAFPKMHCSPIPLVRRHKMTQALLSHVNISWTCWL